MDLDFIYFHRETRAMANSRIEDLQAMADEIEGEIEICENDLKRVGSLSIKTQSFANMVLRMDSSSKTAGLLKIKASSFQNKVRILSDRRTREKLDLELELEDSKIRYKKITEARDNALDVQDSEFFSRQSSKLDEFISSSMDSLESLGRQSVYIDRISSTLRSGLRKLGVGSDILHKIESRFAGDRSLFLILMGMLALLILALKTIF